MEEKEEKNRKVEKSSEILRVAQNIRNGDLQKSFPHIYKELGSDDSRIPIDQVIGVDLRDTSQEKGEKTDPFHFYDPTVFDFLERCETNEQALEIIDFIEKRNELSSKQAVFLRQKVKENGIRSICKYRKTGHYFKEAESILSTRSITKRYYDKKTDKE